jgi:hypothetical protein
MDRKLHHEPEFDSDALRAKLDAWKQRQAKEVVVEWSTGTGPTVFVFPAADRTVGFKWTARVETANYNEVYADYIERTLVPRITEIIHSRGLESKVRCVDLQPLQVQRQRRRQIERIEQAAAAH